MRDLDRRQLLDRKSIQVHVSKLQTFHFQAESGTEVQTDARELVGYAKFLGYPR